VPIDTEPPHLSDSERAPWAVFSKNGRTVDFTAIAFDYLTTYQRQTS
jgi:hypothetical protein